jgi:hypothetical protein
MSDQTTPQYELRFQSLVDGQCYAFPCNPAGHVDMDQLSDRVRNDYLFARALVGRDMAPPAMQSCSMCR